MIDISDGLASDLGHILEESGGLGATLEADSIPIHDDARVARPLDGRTPLDHALHDGEDFELCLTLGPLDADRLARRPAAGSRPLPGRDDRGRARPPAPDGGRDGRPARGRGFRPPGRGRLNPCGSSGPASNPDDRGRLRGRDRPARPGPGRGGRARRGDRPGRDLGRARPGSSGPWPRPSASTRAPSPARPSC